MVEFYNQYILPASPTRSKLAIHLNAQATVGADENTDAAAAETGVKALTLKDNYDGEVVPVKEEINRTTPFVITDVREFRSKLLVSAGPQAVKHISEFEEVDPKL